MPALQLKKSPLLEAVSADPLLMREDAAELFRASIEHIEADERLGPLLAMPNAPLLAANDNDFWGNPQDEDDWRNYYRPYNVINGVLQIPIQGVLLDKFSYSIGRWATGYKYIEMALKRGLEDPQVKAIALVVDSPGGMVAGCFELADKIYAARKVKPIRAFASDHAYSAAYALSSAANDIIVTRSGGVGSVGVVTVHISYQDAYAKAGIKVTFITAGEGKADGNSAEDLAPAAKKRIQARINKIYGVFTATVARHRGMDVDTVVALKAYTYDSEEATENGLADKVGALEEELVIFTEEVNETGDEYMSTQAQGNVTGKAPANSGEGIDQATYDKGVTDAKAAGVSEGHTAGMAAQKERFSAILGGEAAKARPAAALHCALNSDMSAEQTEKFLAGLPEEKKTTAAAPAATTDPAPAANANRNHFAETMNNSQHPNVGTAEDGEDDDPTASAVNGILGAMGSAGSGKKRPVAKVA